VTGGLQVGADRLGGLPQRRRVHDGDPLAALDHRGQLAEQPVPDDDVVRRGAPDGIRVGSLMRPT
jgi:hypothetical protein